MEYECCQNNKIIYICFQNRGENYGTQLEINCRKRYQSDQKIWQIRTVEPINASVLIAAEANMNCRFRIVGGEESRAGITIMSM